MSNKQFNDFKESWLPNFKKQYFKAKLLGESKSILEIKENILKNKNLKIIQKEKMLKLIRIKE